jgi:probable rRNA maturation factor
LSGDLLIKNRQRAVPLNTRLLRTLTNALLREILELENFDLAIYIVRASEMARLNETFLQHIGSTDVITFDYSENPKPDLPRRSAAEAGTRNSKLFLHGEIFICIDDARAQARQFRTSWQSELARYIIHGVLHLRGFDDIRPAHRRKMKREENRLLRETSRRFPLRKLGGNPKLTP